MGALSEAQKRGHEMVTYFNAPEVGLKAIVGIHSSVLGPALGGCRMRLYQSEEQALDDVMRLSEGMTYKNSLAGLDIGGGKACIIGDPKMVEGRQELFAQFGRYLNYLAGNYITAEDMGTSVVDMMAVRSTCPYVTGTDPHKGGGGDPSPWTARGVFAAIQAACDIKFGSDNLDGKRVAVQGAGHVGAYLIRSLVKAGAEVTVCDTNEVAVQEIAKELSLKVVPPDAIYDVPCDIFSPCAIGQTVNDDTLKRLHAKIIAGAANNQLTDPSVYSLITKRDILYCPDFVINSGGVTSVAAELNDGGWSEAWVAAKVDQIAATTRRVIVEAAQRKKFTEIVAIELAKERIEAVRKAKQR